LRERGKGPTRGDCSKIHVGGTSKGDLTNHFFRCRIDHGSRVARGWRLPNTVNIELVCVKDRHEVAPLWTVDLCGRGLGLAK
jgi:hypothetical protein